MSESRFTPGPYLRDGACVYKLSKDGVNVFSAQVSSGYDDRGGRTSTEECEAVAQLMQVAPELLAAVRLMLEAYDDGVQPDWAQPAIKASHAAIAKATASPMGKE
jgi:hypothetical protein